MEERKSAGLAWNGGPWDFTEKEERVGPISNSPVYRYAETFNSNIDTNEEAYSFLMEEEVLPDIVFSLAEEMFLPLPAMLQKNKEMASIDVTVGMFVFHVSCKEARITVSMGESEFGVDILSGGRLLSLLTEYQPEDAPKYAQLLLQEWGKVPFYLKPFRWIKAQLLARNTQHINVRLEEEKDAYAQRLNEYISSSEEMQYARQKYYDTISDMDMVKRIEEMEALGILDESGLPFLEDKP